MNLLITYQFGYEGNPRDLASRFFSGISSLLERGEPFPLSAPYQIALVRDRTNEGVFVAILVLSSAPADDSRSTGVTIDAWLRRHGLPPPLVETYPVRGHTIAESLGESYEIIGSVGSLAIPPLSAGSPRTISRRMLGVLCLSSVSLSALFLAWIVSMGSDPSQRPESLGDWGLFVVGALTASFLAPLSLGLARLIIGVAGARWFDRLARYVADASAWDN